MTIDRCSGSWNVLLKEKAKVGSNGLLRKSCHSLNPDDFLLSVNSRKSSEKRGSAMSSIQCHFCMSRTSRPCWGTTRPTWPRPRSMNLSPRKPKSIDNENFALQNFIWRNASLLSYSLSFSSCARIDQNFDATGMMTALKSQLSNSLRSTHCHLWDPPIAICLFAPSVAHFACSNSQLSLLQMKKAKHLCALLSFSF